MSVQSEITRIETNIDTAYNTLEEMGATMPTEENSANLASTIASLGGQYADAEHTHTTLNFASLTVKDAGSSTSGAYLATKWAVSGVNGITTPTNGMTITIRTPGSGCSGGILLSIDGGTTYYPIVRNVNSLATTHYGAGSTLILTFNSTQTASPYTTSGATTTVTGCWQVADYDSNTRNTVGDYRKNDTKLYFVGTTSSDSATSSSYATSYTNSNCYVGTDNCLYSGGKKVIAENDHDFADEIGGVYTIAGNRKLWSNDAEGGIIFEETGGIFKEASGSDEIVSPLFVQRVPIAAGNNVTFETDTTNQLVKINATVPTFTLDGTTLYITT